MSKEDRDNAQALLASGRIRIPNPDDSWKDMLVCKHTRGQVILQPDSLVNTIVLLQYEPRYRGVFVYNEFSDETMVYKCPPWEDESKFKIHRLTHEDIVRCAAALEYLGMNASIQRTSDAINDVAKKNAVHPIRDWLRDLQWDGDKRLHTWLMDYAGASGEEQPETYLGQIGTMWMTAAVRRIMEPGCKFDHMLILEGAQNIGKSTLLKTLATIKANDQTDETAYFTDAIRFSNIHESSSIMTLQGKMIVEFSELAGMSRREIEDVKNWVTIQTDELQKKYKNEIDRFPRQFVLAGTTNEDSWLRDHTGNRRFLPVKCIKRVNIPGLIEVREQLWAEAMFLYESGENLFIDYGSELETMASAEQAKRLIEDVWTNPVLDAIKSYRHVTVNEVLALIPVEAARRDENAARRIGRILRANGWQSQQKWINGRNTKVFANPEKNELFIYGD